MTTLEEIKHSLAEARAAHKEASQQQAQAMANPSQTQKRIEADIRVKSLAERLRGLEQDLAAAEAAEAQAQAEAKAAAERAAAEAAAAAARAAWKRHTVAAGETLSHISLKYYKTANRWKEIYEANRDVIGDNHNLIKPGQELVIPDTQA